MTNKTNNKEYSLEQILRATLYSIGDAVIATDKRGRVTLMNPVAEKLTGWKEREARGKALSTVFRIVNEETRKKVESPVARVLREGIVVGLANHTILISRNGKEIPIAGAGAPIKDDSGKVVGVVLVFRDQTAERMAQRAVQDAREFAESIIATVREPLLVLDETLEVVAANRSFYNIFKVKPEETIGKKVYRLGNGQWNIPELR
jgi:PAS domain S-box-containing protein